MEENQIMHSCQSSSILQFSFKWRITFKIHIYKFQADKRYVWHNITFFIWSF